MGLRSMSRKTNSRALARTWPYTRYEPFVKELRKVAKEWFKAKSHPVRSKKAYILDEHQNWRRNVILPEVADYIEAERQRRQSVKQGFPLHNHVHHGLSSQAMLFNLVGPLIVRRDLSPLKAALGASGVAWPKGNVEAVLEVEDRDVFNEDAAQPTSIDLVLRSDNGEGGIYVECKFIEPKFNGCSLFGKGNCEGQNPALRLERCYLHHIGRRYWTRMAEHGLLTNALKDSPICPLANYYQFFREVLFALSKGGTFVLLHDPRNPTFVADGPYGQRGLLPFLTSLLPASVRDKVKRITIQDVLQAAKAAGGHEDWTDEFAAKYGMTP